MSNANSPADVPISEMVHDLSRIMETQKIETKILAVAMAAGVQDLIYKEPDDISDEKCAEIARVLTMCALKGIFELERLGFRIVRCEA